MVLSSSSMTFGPVMGAATAGEAGTAAGEAGAAAEAAGVAAEVAGMPADWAAGATGALSTSNSAGNAPERK
jgi:hypothetical protein